MNPCEQLKETLVTDGQQAIEQSEPLTAHLQNCADCQQLIQAWLQIPQLLEQLPEYEPDDELLHTVSEAATAPAGKNSQRRRFLAPSLASAVVVLAVIGLSREMILHESPKTPYVLERQRDIGQTVRKPDVDSSSGRRNDTYLKPERQKPASEFEIAGQDRLEETLNYRSDDARLADSPQDVQQITELDQLKQSGKHARDAEGLYESEPGFVLAMRASLLIRVLAVLPWLLHRPQHLRWQNQRFRANFTARQGLSLLMRLPLKSPVEACSVAKATSTTTMVWRKTVLIKKVISPLFVKPPNRHSIVSW